MTPINEKQLLTISKTSIKKGDKNYQPILNNTRDKSKINIDS
jgi:hypothetical protein